MQGVPLWYAKQVNSSSDYTLWKLYFASKWKDSNKLAYEFALTRSVIKLASMNEFSPKSIEQELLSNRFTNDDIPYEWLDEEDQKARVEAEKIRAKQAGF